MPPPPVLDGHFLEQRNGGLFRQKLIFLVLIRAITRHQIIMASSPPLENAAKYFYIVEHLVQSNKKMLTNVFSLIKEGEL